jgi:hypothetical protein
VATLAPTHARAGDTLLVVRSAPGKLPGGLDSLVLRTTGVQMYMLSSPWNGLRLETTGAHNWSLRCDAGRMRALEPRLYPYADALGGFTDSLSSFNVYGDGVACGETYSYFDVRQIAYAANGTVSRAHLLFELACGSSSVRTGEFRWDADTTAQLTAPLHVRARRGTMLTFDVSATHAEGLPLTISPTELPPGATFLPLGGNAGRVTWTPLPDQQGDFQASFAVDDGAGHGETAHTLVQVDGDTLVDVVSEAGDRLSPGSLMRLRPGGVDVSAALTSSLNVTVTPEAPARPSFYYAALTADGTLPLRPGNYAMLRRWSDENFASFSFVGPNAGCPVVESAFRIRRLSPAEVIPSSTGHGVRELWIEWEQHCEGEAPAYRGELRRNAGSAVVVYAPIARRVHFGDTLSFEVTGRDTLGRALTIQSGALPPGATFTPSGSGSATFLWMPGISSIGAVRVMFTAQAASGPADTVYTDILVSGDFTASIHSEHGDPAGNGLSLAWSGAPGMLLTADLYNDYEIGIVDRLVLAARGGIYQALLQDKGGLLGHPGRFVLPWPGWRTNPSVFVCYDASRSIPDPYAVDVRVRRLERTPTQNLRSLWLEFEQRTADLVPTLSGEYRWNVVWHVLARAPLRRSVSAGSPLSFEVSGETPEGEIPEVSALGLPTGAVLTPTSPGHARFDWTPSAADVGAARTATFLARRMDGSADTASTVLETLPQAEMEFDDGTRHWHLSSADGEFRTRAYTSSAYVHFSSPAAETSWTMWLRTAPQGTLDTGIVQTPGAAGSEALCVTTPTDPYPHSYYQYCDADSGSFDIVRIARDASGGFSELWATFDDRHYWLRGARAGWLDLGPEGLVSVPPAEPANGAAFTCRGFAPSPLRSGSRLLIETPVEGALDLAIFDILGRARITERWHLPRGARALNVSGIGALTPGVYVARVEFAGQRWTKRVTVLR